MTTLGARSAELALGVNLGHDRSACLAVGGRVEVAIAEERLSRRKHDIPRNVRGERYCFFPRRAVEYCLEACGVGYEDVDVVVANTTYVLDTVTGLRRQLTEDDVRWQCPELAQRPIRVVGHHHAHAASAALCSGLDRAAVLVVDGGGSIVAWDATGKPERFERTTILRLVNRRLTVVHRNTGGPPDYGNSIGDFYQLLTCYLGFRTGQEGKTMGLAAYRDMYGALEGAPRWEPLKQFRDAIIVRPTGAHEISPEFQFTPDGGFHPQLIDWFGPPRSQARPDEALDRHVAASAQWALEEAIVQLARAAKRITGERNVCFAGGVALNVVANSRIRQDGLFEKIFIQPAATDDGIALGNALLGAQLLEPTRPHWVFTTAYLGRQYPNAEIDAALAGAEGSVEVTRPADVPGALASDLTQGQIVAVFRGGGEFGPRALGHRSILCDPRRAEMKDRLNLRVKHREAFRPFAPLVPEECSAELFELDVPSPYMLYAADVRRPDLIPAVTHVDGSARVQTVARREEPFLWELLHAFGARTGVPVLLNTSFNVAGEPIVETPGDALASLLREGIDVLFIEDRRVVRRSIK